MSTTAVDYDITRALAERGVTLDVLGPQRRRELDELGYTVIPQLLTEGEVSAMVRRLDEIFYAEGERAGSDFQKEPGTQRVGALVTKDPVFDRGFLDPLVLDGVSHMIGGEFGLSSLTSRAALPGAGRQSFHADGGPLVVGGHAIWMLDEFTVANGATRIVPGSHLTKRAPFVEGDSAWTADRDHPQQQHVTGPAGTLVLMRPSLWHAGSLNTTTQPRRLLSAYFGPRGQYQGGFRGLTPAMRERFDRSALYILDHVAEPT
jgi:ectoine hydroxylase-related dioxygenase (phytanoyl-CoA dioxygenase family)